MGCSHQRAWEYFIESIKRPNTFLTSHCEPSTKNSTDISCDKNITAYMGLHADKRYKISFSTKTNRIFLSAWAKIETREKMKFTDETHFRVHTKKKGCVCSDVKQFQSIFFCRSSCSLLLPSLFLRTNKHRPCACASKQIISN